MARWLYIKALFASRTEYLTHQCREGAMKGRVACSAGLCAMVLTAMSCSASATHHSQGRGIARQCTPTRSEARACLVLDLSRTGGDLEPIYHNAFRGIVLRWSYTCPAGSRQILWGVSLDEYSKKQLTGHETPEVFLVTEDTNRVRDHGTVRYDFRAVVRSYIVTAGLSYGHPRFGTCRWHVVIRGYY
jgi:hypothetical protein